MSFLFFHLKAISFKLKQNHVSAYAGQSAYFTLLSILPFLMFLLTLLQHTSIDTNSVFEIVRYLIPEIYHTSIRNLLYEIQKSTSTALLSLTLIVTIWTAAKGIHAISSGLNVIYKVEDTHNFIFLRLHSMLYTFFFAIVIILTMIVLIFGNRIFEILTKNNAHIPNVVYLLLNFRPLFSFFVFFIICTLFYTFLPFKQQILRHQITGSLFTSTSWLTGGYIFSIYIDNIHSSNYLYGSLSYLILFLIYLYFLIYLFFVGAQINRYLFNACTRKKTI